MDDSHKTTVLNQKTLVPIGLMAILITAVAGLLVNFGIYQNKITEHTKKIESLEEKVDRVPSQADYKYLSDSVTEIKTSLKEIANELKNNRN